MPKFKTTPDAARLLIEGQIAHCEIERAGVRVDVDYLDRALDETADEIRELEERLRADDVYRVWRRRFGEGTKLGAPAQLSAVFFQELGYKARSFTDGGASGKGEIRAKADEAAFEGIDHPFVKTWFEAAHVRKARNTYLMGIKRELVEHDDGWYIHPSYALNRARTFRPACRMPNWQNQPSRNPVMAERVRRCYIPRDGNQIVEIDYSQAEVKVGVCYHEDENMIKYVTDSRRDMHRDAAAKLFFLSTAEAAHKPVRAEAKGGFVFAEFYGSYYVQVARAIWDALALGLTLADGTDLRDRLARHGITRLGACDPKQKPEPGTFEAHVQATESWLWDTMFPGYKQWKRDWYNAYLRNGGFQMLSGFAVNGFLSRNDATNYPIQGASFHCLLWALPRIQAELKRKRMKSRIVGEIHDCLVADVPPGELQEFVEICHRIMTVDIAKEWRWLIVPLEAECEAADVDASWFEKKAYVKLDGVWRPKPKKVA